MGEDVTESPSDVESCSTTIQTLPVTCGIMFDMPQLQYRIRPYLQVQIGVLRGKSLGRTVQPNGLPDVVPPISRTELFAIQNGAGDGGHVGQAGS